MSSLFDHFGQDNSDLATWARSLHADQFTNAPVFADWLDDHDYHGPLVNLMRNGIGPLGVFCQVVTSFTESYRSRRWFHYPGTSHVCEMISYLVINGTPSCHMINDMPKLLFPHYPSDNSFTVNTSLTFFKIRRQKVFFPLDFHELVFLVGLLHRQR